ncbi:hypothetical protein [Nesterenkonia lutea]|uniref:Uncharacterized protein n=1 Tax=Nesterenkonia lutea TaxID=272919 RepID=A0ABR9JH31_9MICC|nr:hypothetical protein [Nesterenkonia lutea]MBE1525235.1 hypothetical protein [Nesterenkonia lutea]
MSMMWTGLVVNLLLLFLVLAVVAFMLHAVIRAGVRNGLRDHDQHLQEQERAARRGGAQLYR